MTTKNQARQLAAARYRWTPNLKCRPYTESWIHGTLAPFAAHYRTVLETSDLDHDAVLTQAREQLLAMILPFLRSEYQRMSRNLPPTADVHALEEAVFDAAMRAAAGFTPEQFLTWPALLKAKMSVAPVEAARVDSRISRRHAKFAAAYRVAEERETQRLSRSLTPTERTELAERVTPRTRRENWPEIVQQNVRIFQVESLPDEGRLVEADEGVEVAELRLHSAELRQAFYDAVHQLPAEVQGVIYDELERIANGSEPRVSVVRRVESHMPPELRLLVI